MLSGARRHVHFVFSSNIAIHSELSRLDVRNVEDDSRDGGRRGGGKKALLMKENDEGIPLLC